MLLLLSKALVFLQNPLNWVVILVVEAAILLQLRRKALAARLTALAAVLLVLLGFTSIPDTLILALEHRHATEYVDPAAFEGAIVLGGIIDAEVTLDESPQVGVRGSAERMAAALMLSREHPEMKVLFTGFDAEAARVFFERNGLAADRVLYETRSQNTYDNAALSRRVPGVDATKPWILVTSARHMPRALAVFRKVGWNVQPLPVDYTKHRARSVLEFSPLKSAMRWEIALHELFGLAVYRVTGRI